MELKHKLLCGSVALNIIWISTLIIDFDIQSWIPTISVQKVVSSLTEEEKMNTTVGYATTQQFKYQTESSLAPAQSTAMPSVPFVSYKSLTSLPPYAKKSTSMTKLSTTTVPSTMTSSAVITSASTLSLSTINVPSASSLTPADTTRAPTLPKSTIHVPFTSSLSPADTTRAPTLPTSTIHVPFTSSLSPVDTTRAPTLSTSTIHVPFTSSLSPVDTTRAPTLSTSTIHVPSTSSPSPAVTTKATMLSTLSTKSAHVATSSKPYKQPLKKNKTVGNDPNFLINLPGCKIKYYNPFDAEVKPYYSKKTNQQCGSSFAFVSGTEIRIDKDAMSKALKIKKAEIICKIYQIARAGEGSSDRQYSRNYLQNITDKYNATQEFLEVSCLKGNDVVYDDFFAFIQRKESVEQRCNNATKHTEATKEKFNIVFIGIDSVSHRNFLRHFPKTYNELNKNFDVLEYDGYTKIGLNTFPCLMPLFTGKSEEDLNPGKGPFDNIPFIWKNFSHHGYRTLFAEDWPSIAIFHYLKKGFYYQPVDYYLRAFYLATQDSKMRKLARSRCFNSRVELTVPLNWCRDFLTVFSDEPVFSFTFMSHLTHDYLNDAGYGDAPFYDFLKWFKTSTVRNNTFLILFSDHGIRWGGFRSTDMGAQEDSLPFFLLMPPPSFKRVYPLFYNNLKINQYRLMTMFDVHEMLKDILNFTGKPRDIKPTFHQRGVSLFEEIPKDRTCEDAGIGPEYCVCHIRKHIHVNSSLSIAAAKKLVEAINQKTERERNKCAVLALHNVTSARHYTINKRNDKKELKTLDSFKLTLHTEPGEGLFEGVVLCELNSTSECITQGEIDRINKYGNQSSCINNSVTKNYCYCSKHLQNITKKS